MRRLDSLENIVRALLVIKGDVRAVAKGRIVPRIGRRAFGKITGRMAGKMFDPR